MADMLTELERKLPRPVVTETGYCACLIATHAEALAVAARRARETGLRQEVWRGPASGWHATSTGDPVPGAGEPCS